MIRSPKYLKSARGKSCQMRIPGHCNGNPDTVVAAHSNLGRHGKGMGIKAADVFVAHACSGCHDAYDGRVRTQYGRDELQEFWQRGFERTLVAEIAAGVIRLP